jgi:serine protease
VNVDIVVATPSGHSTTGFGTSFCAYHGKLSDDPNVTYTNLPYITDAGKACGEDSVNGTNGTLDGVSIVEGHELAEVITDPLLNAWYDSDGNEIGDKCAWTGLANLSTTSGTFAVQPLWSNGANGCVLSSGGIATA